MNIFSLLGPYEAIGKVLAVLALVAGLIAGYFAWEHHIYSAGVTKGKADIQALWDADKAVRITAEKKALADRLTANAVQEAAQAETVRLLKKGYENEQATDRALAAKSGRMRFNKASICGPGPAASQETTGASGSPAEVAATGLLPEPYAGNIDALMLEADLVVASCRAAQTFIIGNGLAP
jgi:hypothetical protein